MIQKCPHNRAISIVSTEADIVDDAEFTTVVGMGVIVGYVSMEVVMTDVGVTEGVETGLLVTEDGSGQDCVLVMGSVAEFERHTSH